MSFEAMHKVRASGLTDRTLVDVLDALAFFQNQETGACFPSTEAIARVSRLSPNIVRKAIKELEHAGYISTKQRPGSYRHFVLHLDRLPVGVSDLEGGSKVEGVTEVTPPPCQKCEPSPVRSVSVPLPDVTVEQGKNKESNQISNKVEKRQKTASKSKRTRLTIEDLPDDWREYCEKNAPEIDPYKAWEDFKDYWQVRAKDPLSADWKRTWQSNVRKLHSGPDWMITHLLKNKSDSRYQSKFVLREKPQSERVYGL